MFVKLFLQVSQLQCCYLFVRIIFLSAVLNPTIYTAYSNNILVLAVALAGITTNSANFGNYSQPSSGLYFYNIYARRKMTLLNHKVSDGIFYFFLKM